MHLKIIATHDGSPTVFIPELNEHYHSVNGAITESRHVYIERGYLHHKGSQAVVLEIGFGTGLNALLTALSAAEIQRPTHYISAEKFPLPEKIIHQLPYGLQISEKARDLFKRIHACPWEQPVSLSPYFSLLKLKADITDAQFAFGQKGDVVYFDAFGPDKQTEMWQPAVLKRMYEATANHGILVTYSAKGAVRRNLAACGYTMERLPGPPGKFQMLRGIKQVANI